MEGDAGTSQLNPISDSAEPDERSREEATSPDEPEESAVELEVENDSAAEPVDDGRRAERFGRGWFIGIVAALAAVAVAVGVGGFFAMRAQSTDRTMAAEDAMALDRAKECVAATQAPDIAAMTASQSKIIECSTGQFAVQANLFAGMLVDAYQAAQAAVKVAELRAAVEKHNDDGSVDVLVAMRILVTNSQAADQAVGYRLRVTMAPEDGTYRISSLDQVTS
jgi:Mce-associated membrane protein